MLLAAILRITTFIPSRFQIDGMNILRPLVYKEHSILSGHFRIHSKIRTTDTPQLFRRGSENSSERSNLQMKKFSPEHSQGQPVGQNPQWYTGLSGTKVEFQGQEKFSGRTDGVIALVGVITENPHPSCVRFKRTWMIMWPGRHSRPRSPRALDQRLRDGMSSLKYLLSLGKVVHLESRSFLEKLEDTRHFWLESNILVDRWPRGPFDMKFTTSTPFLYI